MNQRKLYQWIGKVSKEWTGFSRHFRTNVSRFSVGVALSHSSHIRRIAGCVSGDAASQRRRLQRFVATSWDMQTFFSQWTASVVRSLKLKSLVLVVDETKLKARFGVLVVGVAYEGRCIPLAWRVYRANSSAEYPSEGQVGIIMSLLKAIATGISPHMPVRVLADRAIGTSPALMRGIMDLNWTFLFRVTRQSKLIQWDGQEVTIYNQVTQVGEQFAASGIVFKNRGRIPAHVRVLWGQEAQERWALVTNDPQLTGWEYVKRAGVDALLVHEHIVAIRAQILEYGAGVEYIRAAVANEDRFFDLIGHCGARPATSGKQSAYYGPALRSQQEGATRRALCVLRVFCGEIALR